MDDKEKMLSDAEKAESLQNDNAVTNDALSQEETTQEIHDEMEQLAAVFQEELNKATAQAQATQTVEATTPAETPEEPQAPLEPEELCACCGEKKRGTVENPDSLYCAECDRGLRHYPFDILNIILVFAAIALVFYGGYVFANHTETYVPVLKADKYKSEQKLYSAMNEYTIAANAMLNNHINGELVFKRELLTAYDLGVMNILPETAEKIKPFEFKLPHFQALRLAVDEAESYMVTSMVGNQLVQPYETKAPSAVPFDELIEKLEALLTTTPEPLEAEEKEGVYQPAAPVYKPAMLAFYKYYVALLAEKDIATQLRYVEEIKAAAPDALWLYGSLLGDLYAKSGKDIEPICKAMEAFNQEDDTPALLRVEKKRIEKNPEEAISMAEEMLKADSTLSVEFLRQQALSYLALNDFKEAFEKAKLSFDYAVNVGSPSIQVCNTYALCALASGNQKEYDAIGEMLKESEIEVSAEVLGYKDGSVSLQTILEEGDCDL